MHRLYPPLTQPRHHPVNVLLSYAEGDVILCRAAVDYRVDAKKPKHPALMCLRVNQQGTRPIASAKPEFEAEFCNIEVN
jgi:hypothetical protein